ncbi:MAG: YciI family protein [Novosphingobium sp.]
MSTFAVRALCAVLALALAPAASLGAARPRQAAAAAKPPTPADKRTAQEPAPEAPVAKGRLYAVLLGPGAAWKRGQPFKGPGLDEHRRYWKKLLGEGRVASAGPVGNETGLVLLRARNQSEADGIVAADPAVKARILRGVARPYSADLVSAAVLVGR